MLEWLRFSLTALALLAGLLTLAAAVRGVYKFDYVLNRMHAAAIGDTLGLLICLLALIISADSLWTALKFGLIIVFLWLASPVGSHLIARLEVSTNEAWQSEDIETPDEKGGEET